MIAQAICDLRVDDAPMSFIFHSCDVDYLCGRTSDTRPFCSRGSANVILLSTFNGDVKTRVNVKEHDVST